MLRGANRLRAISANGTDLGDLIRSVEKGAYDAHVAARRSQVTIRTVVEYMELAQGELDQSEASDSTREGFQQHLMRAQVFATLAVAKATSDKP